MGEPNLVAVKATEKRFYVLRHEPSGATLDEKGEGTWPADQFTFRLRDEKAIKLVEPVSDTEANASPVAKPKVSAPKKQAAKSPVRSVAASREPSVTEPAAPVVADPPAPENPTTGDAGQEA